ncbi:MAG: PGPGW domain-containing protein [Acidimicrobiales bacterium]
MDPSSTPTRLADAEVHARVDPSILRSVDPATESVALEPVGRDHHLESLPPVVPPRRARVARQAKRVGVGVAGTTVCGAGVAMLVLPGPGLVVIVAGLAILATEFAWAERRLEQAKAKAAAAAEVARNAGRRSRRPRG